MVTEKGKALRAQLALQSATNPSALEVAPSGATPTMSAPVSVPLSAPTPVPVSVDAAVATPARLVPENRTPSPSDARAWLKPADPIVFRPPVSPLPTRTSLAGRFLAELEGKPELPQPSAEQRHRLVEWLQHIERALRRLAALALRLTDLRERRQRDDTARCTFLVEGDAARRRRTEARDAVSAWTDTHLWQQRVNRLLSIERKPAELVALEGAVTSCNTELAFFERGATDAVHRVAGLDARIAMVDADQVQTQDSLMGAVQALHAQEPLYGLVLLTAVEPGHVPAVTAVLPVTPASPVDAEVTVTLRTPESALVLKPAQPRVARPAM
ncbi:hypothetical protein [Frateuria defendens]|uniref:hypothetical protein n=1 Tax=Frateuria defendens TaxID=2219559 RepID=UPI001292E9A1|nr:hypothetical protein [Frateuria defendens]